MVSSTQINHTLAHLTGANKHQLDRNTLELRKVGIIESKGRGRSAAQMGFKDVRNIVFALLGAETPKEAPKAVIDLMRLETKDGLTLGDAFMDYFDRMGEGDQNKRAEFISVCRTIPQAEIVFRCFHDGLPAGDAIKLIFRDPAFDYEQAKAFNIEATISHGIVMALLQILYHHEQAMELSLKAKK